jgi:hypothetical protein
LSLNESPDSTTFKMYVYLVKQGRFVGPREVMHDMNLSSPSVAYRHLQKLEELSLAERNSHGEYIAKERVSIKGHLWVGRNLVPRLWFYSFFFVGVLIIETISAVQQFINGNPPETSFVFLVLLTCIAIAIFMIEGITSRSPLL